MKQVVFLQALLIVTTLGFGVAAVLAVLEHLVESGAVR